MDYGRIASDILANVGGKENVKSVTHCFTRLRFVLKDDSKAKKDVVEHLEGVISVVVAGGQFQVVCGAKVTKIYDAVLPLVGDLDDSASEGSPEDFRDLHTHRSRYCGSRTYQGTSGGLFQTSHV